MNSIFGSYLTIYITLYALHYVGCCQPGGFMQLGSPNMYYENENPPAGMNYMAYTQPLSHISQINQLESNQQLPLYNQISSNNIQEPTIAYSFKMAESGRCAAEIFSKRDFLSCVQIAPLNRYANLTVNAPSSCNFDTDTLCRFYSSPTAPVQWNHGRFKYTDRRIIETFLVMTSRSSSTFPQGDFIFVDESLVNDNEQYAILEAAILCQDGDGKLTFEFWKNDNYSVIKVCTSTEEIRSCTQTINYAESPSVTVDVIHPEVHPFYIEIIVSNLTGSSLVIIDNLIYDAVFCDDTYMTTIVVSNDENLLTNSLEQVTKMSSTNLPFYTDPFQTFFENTDIPEDIGETMNEKSIAPSHFGINLQRLKSYGDDFMPIKRAKPRKTLFIQKLTICDILNCDFDNGLCNYHNVEGFSKRHGSWKISSGRTGNVHTGIKSSASKNGANTDGYAFVGTDRGYDFNNNVVYILESPAFTLLDDVVLKFDLYKRSNGILLQVCLNEMNNCIYNAPKVQKGFYWRRNEQVVLDKSTKKIFFIATQRKRFRWIAIDNIRVINDENCKRDDGIFIY